ncbi:MAG: EscU/YscU/HrcU family type III secretion system export apparatus switch protein [Treponema sp.]|nr:EscU/YscU/HrcU family type III secretion system export apparatus switch protein [Treponema sp.]MCL2271419.1 EscU/YscU/HrcU family type III secretion system export apparatus switch protein [Treponema sp.]
MKKKKLASAVGYNKGEAAPVLLASGRGREAERIIAIAEEAGIAVVEDTALAVLLDTSAKPGDLIPPWCWEAAAKVLSFVIQMDNRKRY